MKAPGERAARSARPAPRSARPAPRSARLRGGLKTHAVLLALLLGAAAAPLACRTRPGDTREAADLAASSAEASAPATKAAPAGAKTSPGTSLASEHQKGLASGHRKGTAAAAGKGAKAKSPGAVTAELKSTATKSAGPKSTATKIEGQAPKAGRRASPETASRKVERQAGRKASSPARPLPGPEPEEEDLDEALGILARAGGKDGDTGAPARKGPISSSAGPNGAGPNGARPGAMAPDANPGSSAGQARQAGKETAARNFSGTRPVEGEVSRGGGPATSSPGAPAAPAASAPASPPAGPVAAPAAATAASGGKPPAAATPPAGAPPPLLAQASPPAGEAPPALGPGEAAQEPLPAKQRPPRPPGKTSFYTFFHKTGEEFVRFLAEQFPEVVEQGHVSTIEGKPRSVLFFGDDAAISQLSQLANEFDDLGLLTERMVIRPRFIDVAVAMEALTMAGVANVWNRVEENVTTNWMGPDGKVQKTYTHKQSVYAKGGLAMGASSPSPVPAKIPYVFEMPWVEPFQMPPVSTGKATVIEQFTVDFKGTSSTEKRGTLVAVGTREDLERIQQFLEEIDQPARLVMIEVQLIELDASRFVDLGIDSFQLGKHHTIIGGAFNLPGEPLPQPGIPGGPPRDPSVFIPPNVVSGITTMFDDSTLDLSSRFMATIHALVRTGDAKVKARPKILALDDRASVLHIGEEIPTFESTGVSREVTGGNFVEQVNRVTTQYVGFTLNMRPRISGHEEDEVSLLLEVVASKLKARQQVFAEDLLGVPNVTRRRFLGETRVQNHRPIIIGGLIQEEEGESTSGIPILGEIPVLKYLFSRRVKSEERIEVILILTPHILSENTPDRVASPKESVHFDTFDSVLFNDRHIIKGRDIQGIDPITKQPANANGRVFTEAEVIDLSLLKIVRDRKLVSKLNIFDEYLPVESRKLRWLQRKFPERLVRHWSPEKQEVYFKAAAIVIENIKELNPDLTYEELVKPRREIVLPTTPYRMTLSYDKYKTLLEEGQYLLRGERVELSPATVELLKETAETRSVREFADFLEKAGVKAEDHGEAAAELERLARKLRPEDEKIAAADYPGLYRHLAGMQIDFMVMATYFQENLGERYRATGPPNVGRLEKDLLRFLKSTVTIGQRARRLRELDSRWTSIAGDSGGEEGPETGQPEREEAGREEGTDQEAGQ